MQQCAEITRNVEKKESNTRILDVRANQSENVASVNLTHPNAKKAITCNQHHYVLQMAVSRTQRYQFRGNAGCFALLVR